MRTTGRAVPLARNLPGYDPGNAPPEAPIDCPLCPRLVAFRAANAAKFPLYFNAPVPSFGDPAARLLVMGMAPGLHGANATGRPFTGDGAGEFLYRALVEFGFAHGTYDRRADDGLVLRGAMITNAVRCVPPQNRPTGEEARTCQPFAQSRMAALPELRVVLTLGKIAHDATLRALGLKLKDHKFGHGAEYAVSDGAGGGRITLLSSYHTSRYNVNTGVLTWEMFREIFSRCRALADAPA